MLLDAIIAVKKGSKVALVCFVFDDNLGDEGDFVAEHPVYVDYPSLASRYLVFILLLFLSGNRLLRLILLVI